MFFLYLLMWCWVWNFFKMDVRWIMYLKWGYVMLYNAETSMSTNMKIRKSQARNKYGNGIWSQVSTIPPENQWKFLESMNMRWKALLYGLSLDTDNQVSIQMVHSFCVAFQKMSMFWQLVIIERPLDTQTDSSTFFHELEWMTSEAIAILDLFTMPILTLKTLWWV